jgi:hypothetical protein
LQPGGDVPADDPTAEGLVPLAGSCDIELSQVAIYQGVKIALAKDGAPPETPAADVVARRAALFRAFVTPSPNWAGRPARVRLVLRSGGKVSTYVEQKAVAAPSTEGSFPGTFNFQVPADVVTEEASYAVEIVGPTSCKSSGAKARFPATGEAPLRARRTGTLKVKLVPVRYDADGSGRLPETGDSQLARYGSHLAAMYPVEGVDLSVREPVAFKSALDFDGWATLLDSLRDLREKDRAPADLYYYGLVVPGDTFSAYCRGNCTAGLSYLAESSSPSERVGVGLGWAGFSSVETLAHELGHSHGRMHSPCGPVGDADIAYPYKNGGIGVWGYDIQSATLRNPDTNKDVMGYCRPMWVSDFTYRALTDWSAIINVVKQALVADGEGVPGGAADSRPLELAQRWRVLLVDASGNARWGRPLDRPIRPAGKPERARVHLRGSVGDQLLTVEVYRIRHADGGGATLLVPPPQSGWQGIEVAGARRHSFFAPVSVPALDPAGHPTLRISD